MNPLPPLSPKPSSHSRQPCGQPNTLEDPGLLRLCGWASSGLALRCAVGRGHRLSHDVVLSHRTTPLAAAAVGCGGSWTADCHWRRKRWLSRQTGHCSGSTSTRDGKLGAAESEACPSCVPSVPRSAGDTTSNVQLLNPRVWVTCPDIDVTTFR
jgi:hypothetical protein